MQIRKFAIKSTPKMVVILRFSGQKNRKSSFSGKFVHESRKTDTVNLLRHALATSSKLFKISSMFRS